MAKPAKIKATHDELVQAAHGHMRAAREEGARVTPDLMDHAYGQMANKYSNGFDEIDKALEAAYAKHKGLKENILGAAGDPSIDIENPETKARVNSLLGQALETSFLTPYMGIERISNVLAKFHIPIPKSTFLEGDHGYKVFEVNQFGTKFGMNDQGEVVQKDGCSCSIYFEYQLNDSGEFDIFAEIVSEEELDEILDDVEDEEEEMNEEMVTEAKIPKPDLNALRAAVKHLRVTIKTEKEKQAAKKMKKKVAVAPPSAPKKDVPSKKASIKRIISKAAKIKKATPKKPSSAAIVKAAAAVKKKPAVKKAAPKADKKVIVRKASVKATPIAAKPKPKTKDKPKDKAKQAAPKAPVKAAAKPKTTKKKITEPKKKSAVAKAAIKKVKAKTTAPMAPKPAAAKAPEAPKISLYKKASVEPKAELPKVVQKVSSHAPMAPKVPEKPRNAFEIAWDKSAAGPNHTHPHNARALKDIAHAEMQKAVSKAKSKEDYDALNGDYARRMGMIRSLGHHYSETAPYDHIKKHIQDGHIEPDHVILNNMHATTKREYAIGTINKRTHDSRLRTLNRLSKIVHGTTTTPLLPGVDPDNDSKYKSVRKLHQMLGKITRKTPVKVFSEQTMEKALEIMNKKVV